MILLFSVPLIVLGFVSPFAIRLRTMGVASAGGTAGAVSALSTLGSILGTFIPVFFLIPNIGTAATLYTASVALLAFSVVGLAERVAGREGRARHGRRCWWLLSCWRSRLFSPAAGLVQEPIKPPATGTLLYEKELAYNYIQVVRDDERPR